MTLLDLSSAVRGELNDSVQTPIGIVERVVSRLQPDRRASLVDTLEKPIHVSALVQPSPKATIGFALHFFGRAEYTVVLAEHFFESIPHDLEEIFIGPHHGTAQVKFNDRHGTVYRLLETGFGLRAKHALMIVAHNLDNTLHP